MYSKKAVEFSEFLRYTCLMKYTEKELEAIQDLLDKTLILIERNIPKPSKKTNDNTLDVTLESIVVIQSLLLKRFGGTPEESSEIHKIMQSFVDYYNNLYANKSGFPVRVKKKFFKSLRSSQ